MIVLFSLEEMSLLEIIIHVNIVEKKKNISELTYDHIVPKSHRTKFKNKKEATTWLNIVTACKSCNRRKSNKTPEQAGMPLLNKPYVPTKNKKYLPITTHLHKIDTEIPEEWKLYIEL